MQRSNFITESEVKTSHKNKKKGKQTFFIILLIIGIILLIVPIAIGLFFKIEQEIEVKKFKDEISNTPVEKTEEILRISTEYNNILKNRDLRDTFTSEEIKSLSKNEKEWLVHYTKLRSINELLGYVEIPKINTKLPIYTGINSEVLKKGAGHLEGSSLPVGGKVQTA